MNKLPKYIFIGVILISTLFIGLFTALLVYIGIHAEQDTKTKSDAILVLGARSYINGTYNPCLKARVDHAVDLYKKGYAHTIIVTGGNDTEDNVNEATTMQKIAIEDGAKKQDILLERHATSTYENLAFSKAVLKKNKLNLIIIVTEPFHITRASLVANKLQYTYTVSPATNSPCWIHNKYLTKYFLKEPIAISIYKLQNKL